MKNQPALKFRFLLILGLYSFIPKLYSQGFVINSQNGTFTLTCSTTTINLVVTSSFPSSLQCVWYSSPTNSVSGNPQAFSSPGTYTVIITDMLSSNNDMQTFTIYQNTVSPSVNISPLTQVVSCSGPSTANFTASVTNPTTNVLHEWYSFLAPYPVGPVSATASSQSNIYAAMSGPGIYTHVLTNLSTGCKTTQAFTVTSSSPYPTFNVSSNNNFSLGCTPMNQNTICLINASSTNSNAVQFAFLPPGTPSAIPVPTTVFGAQSCTVVSAPGSWTLITNDPVTNCQTALPIVMMQNTVAPTITLTSIPATKTLTCFTPTIMWYCTSGSPFTTSWIIPNIPPITVPGNTLGINTPGTYSAIVTNTVNGCQTSSAVTITQNTVIPNANQIAFGNPSSVSCYFSPVVVSYTANSAGGPPPGGSINIIQSWQGPSPQPTIGGVAQYSVYIPGTYTLTVQNNQNGCIGSHIFNVGTNTTVVSGTATVYTMACTGTVQITAANTLPNSTYSYTWTALPGSGSIVGPLNTDSVIVNGGGQYVRATFKPISNCTITDTVYVHTCVGLNDNFMNALNAKVFPNPAKNYLMVDLPEIPDQMKVEIYDVQGKLIFEEALREKSNKINFDLKQGFYLYRISEKETGVRNGKLIVE